MVRSAEPAHSQQAVGLGHERAEGKVESFERRVEGGVI